MTRPFQMGQRHLHQTNLPMVERRRADPFGTKSGELGHTGTKENGDRPLDNLGATWRRWRCFPRWALYLVEMVVSGHGAPMKLPELTLENGCLLHGVRDELDTRMRMTRGGRDRLLHSRSCDVTYWDVCLARPGLHPGGLCPGRLSRGGWSWTSVAKCLLVCLSNMLLIFAIDCLCLPNPLRVEGGASSLYSDGRGVYRRTSLAVAKNS